MLPYVVRYWWRSEPDYSKRVAYFAARGILLPMRLVVAAFAALLAGICIVDALDDSITSAGREATLGVVAVVALTWCVRWSFGPVPSYRTALLFVLTSNCMVFAVTVHNEDVMRGATGLDILGWIALLVALIMPARALLLHSALSVVWIGYFLVPLVTRYGWAAGAVKVTMLFTTVVAAPLAFQTFMTFLSLDATRSNIDGLTGVPNRRGFLRAARRRIGERHTDAERRVGILVIDVDGFKAMNDRGGHRAGDQALADIAGLIAQYALPAGGVIGRTGGDEFAVAVVGASDSSVMNLAERIRFTVRDSCCVCPAPSTVSIGISFADIPESGLPPAALEALIAGADEAMYEAKRTGDTVVVHGTMTF